MSSEADRSELARQIAELKAERQRLTDDRASAANAQEKARRDFEDAKRRLAEAQAKVKQSSDEVDAATKMIQEHAEDYDDGDADKAAALAEVDRIAEAEARKRIGSGSVGGGAHVDPSSAAAAPPMTESDALAKAASVKADANARVGRGEHRYALPLYEAALEVLAAPVSSAATSDAQATERKALTVACNNNAALCCLKISRFQSAAQFAGVVLSHDSDNVKARLRRASALVKLRSHPAALMDLKRVLAADPTNAEALALRAAAEAAGDDDDQEKGQANKPKAPTAELCTKHSEAGGSLFDMAWNDHGDCLRVAIKARGVGAGLQDQADSSGKTPMHHAAANNGPTAIRALVELHAKVDPVDHNGGTPLRLAAYWGHAACVAALLAAGANVHAVDKKGRTALGWAEKYERADCAALLRAAIDKSPTTGGGAA